MEKFYYSNGSSSFVKYLGNGNELIGGGVLGNRVKKIENKQIIRVDRIIKKDLLNLQIGDIIEVYNSPLDLVIHIQKQYEIRTYGSRQVVYDLKNFIVTDNGVKKPFREIILPDIDTVKKYVSSLHTARLSREVAYIKLLMQKNICIGDVVKRTLSVKTEYLVVQPFEETQADRFVVTCLKLDKNNRLTKDKVRAEFRTIRKMKSIKIRK